MYGFVTEWIDYVEEREETKVHLSRMIIQAWRLRI